MLKVNLCEQQSLELDLIIKHGWKSFQQEQRRNQVKFFKNVALEIQLHCVKFVEIRTHSFFPGAFNPDPALCSLPPGCLESGHYFHLSDLSGERKEEEEPKFVRNVKMAHAVLILSIARTMTKMLCD